MWARRPYEKSSSNERMNASERASPASLKIAENSQFITLKSEFEFTHKILIILGAKIQSVGLGFCSANSNKTRKLNN